MIIAAIITGSVLYAWMILRCTRREYGRARSRVMDGLLRTRSLHEAERLYDEWSRTDVMLSSLLAGAAWPVTVVLRGLGTAALRGLGNYITASPPVSAAERDARIKSTGKELKDSPPVTFRDAEQFICSDDGTSVLAQDDGSGMFRIMCTGCSGLSDDRQYGRDELVRTAMAHADHGHTPETDPEPCPGFPDGCPNLRAVLPDGLTHGGGVRCGCTDKGADHE